MNIRFTIVDSAIGPILVAATHRGVCRISFGDSRRGLESDLRSSAAPDELMRDDAGLSSVAGAVLAMVEGRAPSVDIPLDLTGTEFQKSVWAELRAIPAGQTRSYGDVARRVKRPKAFRAVAQACGANPVPVVIPCHRVIASDGSIGGFSAGLERKKYLLDRERRG